MYSLPRVIDAVYGAGMDGNIDAVNRLLMWMNQFHDCGRLRLGLPAESVVLAAREYRRSQ